MPDRDAAMALFAEDGWRLLVDAGLAFDEAQGDALAAASALAKRRPDAPGARRAAAMELVTEGARLARKLGVDERLLATREAVEQATSGRVATWHAQQIPPDARVLEIGCGCGGDSMALAYRAANLIATDVDPVRAACAHVNLTTTGRATSRVVPGDGFEILAGEASKADVVFVDPDRRTSRIGSRGGAEIAEEDNDESLKSGEETQSNSLGRSPRPPRLRVNQSFDRRRTLDPEQWSPPLSRLVELARGPRRVFVKAAPSLDPDAALGAFRVAYVSYGGECVEAFLESSTERFVRAVLLPDDAPSVELTGDRGDAPSGPLGAAIYMADPAAIRARLLAELCARHALRLVDPGIAFLTGPTGVESPWLRGFDVIRALPLSGNAVGACVAELGASGVRVHARGVPVGAADFERVLAEAVDPRGGGPALDVFLTRGNGAPIAVVARRFAAG